MTPERAAELRIRISTGALSRDDAVDALEEVLGDNYPHLYRPRPTITGRIALFGVVVLIVWWAVGRLAPVVAAWI
jgi:hypothetical protein